MKEIRLSFELRIALKRTDVHWVEEELLRLREGVFLGVLRKVMGEIEEEVLRGGEVLRASFNGEPFVGPLSQVATLSISFHTVLNDAFDNDLEKIPFLNAITGDFFSGQMKFIPIPDHFTHHLLLDFLEDLSVVRGYRVQKDPHFIPHHDFQAFLKPEGSSI